MNTRMSSSQLWSAFVNIAYESGQQLEMIVAILHSPAHSFISIDLLWHQLCTKVSYRPAFIVIDVTSVLRRKKSDMCQKSWKHATQCKNVWILTIKGLKCSMIKSKNWNPCPGLEPGSRAWQARILTPILTRNTLEEKNGTTRLFVTLATCGCWFDEATAGQRPCFLLLAVLRLI